MRFLPFVILLFSLPAYSENNYQQIIEGITPNSITIIGETHKQAAAIQFFQSLITSYLQQNKCLTVALEIASSQQPLLDGIIQGKTAISDIEIAPMIDHPPFRTLINDLAKMQRSTACLKLIAIDAGLELKTNRDEWMAMQLTDRIDEAPILALLGSLHTLKKVEWNQTMSKKKPYVAEILTDQGHNVKTYPQIWKDRTCNNRNRIISADRPETVELLDSELFALLNAFKPKTAVDVIDGIIIWEC